MTRSQIVVEVVYATSDLQMARRVNLPVGAVVAQAIDASGLLAQFPQIDLASQAVGIFGSRVRLGDPVTDGDRIEIYRPLQTDPKEMRRRRARSRRGD